MLQSQMRQRDYSTRILHKSHLFGSYSFNRYGSYIKNHEDLQKVIIRDQLLLILDKLTYLKGNLNNDNAIQQKVFLVSSPRRRNTFVKTLH